MSHLRDIQRLKNTRQIEPIGNARTHYRPVDIYNINFDKLELEPKYIDSHKYHSKQMTSTGRERKSSHKRGSSGGEPQSQGLSLFNYSLKMTNRTPNLPQRRERESPLMQQQFEAHHIKMVPTRRDSTHSSREMPTELTVKHFEPICAVGKGGFGKVWKVEMKKSRQVYAMKEMYKAKIIQKKSINSVMNERKLLAKLRHPFFINMHHAFQDRENLYLIMDYVNGGDLRYHIGRKRRFSQIETKFFVANLVIAFEHLQKNRIIHRDIKPQNLVMEGNGYIRITDLGVSRQLRQENYQDTSGTPGYMAPEVMCRKNHSYTADYFALGVMAYEFMLGRRPYMGRNRKEIRDQILSKQVQLKKEDIPPRWSLESADFINRLLQRNPQNRLGSAGIEQLKRHEWLRTVDFARLERKQLRAPYVPISIEQNYQDYQEQISQDSIEQNAEQNAIMLRRQQVQSLFEGYRYDPIMESKRSLYSTSASESDGRRVTR